MNFSVGHNKYGFHISLKIFHREIGLRIRKDTTTAWTNGIRNSTPDGKRVPFFDYDNYMLKQQLIPELKYFQKKYKLSDMYVFKSSNKDHCHHVICLDKLCPAEWLRILRESNCDENYKLVPQTVDYKSWVLRSTGKHDRPMPSLVAVVRSPFQKREKSRAHALYLKWNYGVDIRRLENLDDNTILNIVQYATANK